MIISLHHIKSYVTLLYTSNIMFCESILQKGDKMDKMKENCLSDSASYTTCLSQYKNIFHECIITVSSSFRALYAACK